MRYISFLICSLLTLPLVAQEDEGENWLGNGRPECNVQLLGESIRKAPRRIGSQATAPLKSHGVQKVPVVLVAFDDKDFITADGVASEVNAFYQKFCNGTMDGQLYKGHGSYGSIRDFFVEQSDSAFLPEFTVMGPVTLSKGYADYGKGYKDTATGISAFTSEAITAAQAAYEGDWSDFDNDGNDIIDFIFFIYAGMGENNYGEDTNLIWPKEQRTSITIGDVTYGGYGLTCECRPVWDDDGNLSGTKTDGVGVFIHELSHGLGLPDFYDTQNVAFGMDLWSVMDYGEYGNNGYNPGAYTAYERDFMGWRQLIDLEEPTVLTIPCFTDGGYGYRIQNDNSANEYYIIENRQAKGWDNLVCAFGGHGLMVTHVDYNATRWSNNTVNTDASHQRMTIVAANNDYRGTNTKGLTQREWREILRGQTYPGTSLNYALTDESTPAAEVYVGGFLHKPLRSIVEKSDGTVTVCFRTNGQLDTPEPNEAEDIHMNSFLASWPTVENAIEYVCELYRDDMLVSCDTLSDTSKLYEGLEDDSALKYRVKALAASPEDYLPSEWSEYVYLHTIPSYIGNISESEKIVTIYNLGGMLVCRCRADELGRIALREGLYIVKYSNGASKKIILK